MQLRSRTVLSFAFYALLMTLSPLLLAEQPDFRLIVTGGLSGFDDGSRAFFDSPLFHQPNDGKQALTLEDVSAHAFRFQDTFLFSTASITPVQIAQMAKRPVLQRGQVSGWISAELLAISFDANTLLPKALLADALQRNLGAVDSAMQWELRELDGVRVLAVHAAVNKAGVVWPFREQDVEAVAWVKASVHGQIQGVSFVPRQNGATARVFGVVDQLLQESPQKSRYLDLGNTLLSGATRLDQAIAMQDLLLERHPVALGVSRAELRAFAIDPKLKNAPYVMALNNNDYLPTLRHVTLAGRDVGFLALGDQDAPKAFLPKELKTLSLTQSLSQGVNADLIFGMTDSPQTAAAAINMPYLDAVLALTPAASGLPMQDEIDLSRNLKAGFRSAAPLVRVSSSDVTEVAIYLDAQHQITKLLVRRYPVLDNGPRAPVKGLGQDQALAQGLPSPKDAGLSESYYSSSDFDAIVGGILLGSDAQAEMVLLDKGPDLSAVGSAVPPQLALSLLDDKGRVASLKMRGKYLKRLFKAIKTGQFGVPVELYGADLKASTIGKREIADAQLYQVLVSERALLALDRFMAQEGLAVSKTLSASTLQAALQESNKEPLKILSEMRKREGSDDALLSDVHALLLFAKPIKELVRERLQAGILGADVASYIQNRNGVMRSYLVAEISDLDLGLKMNAVNQTLTDWQRATSDYTQNRGFTEPRFFDGKYFNTLLYFKGQIAWLHPDFDLRGTINVKYFQPNTEPDVAPAVPSGAPTPQDIAAVWDFVKKARPAKDSVQFQTDFRWMLKDLSQQLCHGQWDFGALSRLTYETNVWPNRFMTNLDPALWPHRVNDLRFFEGLSLKPAGAEERARLGLLLEYDFSRSSPVQSFGVGYEIGGQIKWNVGVIGFRLESSLRHLFPVTTPDVGRMGLVFLTDAKAEVPIYGGFSASLLSSATLGTLMNAPSEMGYGVLFGFALSYSDRLQWQL